MVPASRLEFYGLVCPRPRDRAGHRAAKDRIAVRYVLAVGMACLLTIACVLLSGLHVVAPWIVPMLCGAAALCFFSFITTWRSK